MSAIEQRQGVYHDELLRNTTVTLRVEANTDELVQLLKAAKTGVSFFAGVGRVLRKVVLWCSPFIVFAGMIWAVAHGKWPGSGS